MDAREIWDAEAATFDDEPDHGLHDPSVRAAWRTLLLGVLPPAPARIADLGCGTGTLSLLLAEEGYVVDGVDLSPEMVDRARAKAPALSFAVGDAAAPSLPPASLPEAAYDVVLCRHVLWALPDPVAAVRDWVSLLAPGGRLVMVEGFWSTGAGLTAEHAEEIVRSERKHAEVTSLTDALTWGSVLWGKRVTDERYLLVSLR